MLRVDTMKKRVQRAKRLFKVQQQLLRTELQKLQTLQYSLADAQQAEADAISSLGAEGSLAIPPQLVVRRAAAASVKIQTQQSLLDLQIEKTLGHAKRDNMAKRLLESEQENLSKAEAKRALEATIDAFLERDE
ncbi:MAG: hypothetical protein ACLP1W_15500 [Rhodomicrobium sp.]